MTDLVLREIQKTDEPQVATLIKEVMTSYGCVGEGFSIEDPEVNHMYESYNNDRAIFYVVENNGRILGCGGIAPLEGGDKNTCELKKMYFYPELREKGFGRKMMDTLLQDAKKIGFKTCYLETVERMHRANALYNKYGFKKLCGQEGNTGHCGCDTFYERPL